MFEIFVVSYQGHVAAQPIAATFGPEGGTIGRGPTNTLVLSDPNRFVSRLQARITCEEGHMLVANASSANALLVNDRELEAGEQLALRDGDEIRIGLYLLRARDLSPRPAPSVAEVDETQLRPILLRPVSEVRSLPSHANPDSIDSPPVVAVTGPTDPLKLEFGAAGTDPFADLIGASAPSGGAPPKESRAPVDRATPRPVSGDHASPAQSSGLGHSGELSREVPIFRPQDGPSIPGAPFEVVGSTDVHESSSQPGNFKDARQAPVIPDSVWADLEQLPQRSPSTAPEPRRPIPTDFDAFAAPSDVSRNSEDPLADLAKNSISLDSFERIDKPVEQLFGDTPLSPLSAEPVIPDPNLLPLDPLLGHESVDPLAVFGDTDSPLQIPVDPVFGRSEADNVSELDAFFRPPDSQFEAPVDGESEGFPKDTHTQLILSGLRAIDKAPAGASLPERAGPELSSEYVSDIRVEPPDPATSAQSRVVPPASSRPVPANQKSGKVTPPETQGGFAVDELLAAFLSGAGIPDAEVRQGLTPELMTRIGEMLRTAVQGTIELIATRAMLKREVKAEVTIIASSRNNPLKFLPDGESALLQMFSTRIPGFMSPVEAMEDAFKDLRAHEVGMIAGMRAALAQVLGRFEPGVLEQRLKAPGMLEALLPNSQKARLWDEFSELFVDISREAQDDFQSLFGKAFLDAYEEEVARLKGK